MSVHKWLYRSFSLRDGTFLGFLPLSSVNFSTRINDYGDGTANVNLSDPAATEIDVIAATQEMKTALAIYVDNDPDPQWVGIITRTDGDGVTQPYQITFKTFEWYWTRRLIGRDVTLQQVEQLEYARALISLVEESPYGVFFGKPMRVEYSPSGVKLDIAIKGYDLVCVYDEITTRSRAHDGFDFSISGIGHGNATPDLLLKLGYPRLGRLYSNSHLVFEIPADISNFMFPCDGELMVTALIGIGNTSGDSTLYSEQSDNQALQDGYPLLEETISFPDETVQKQLDSLTLAELHSRKEALTLPSITAKTDIWPDVLTYQAGDDARFRFTGPRFRHSPNGVYDRVFRILEKRVTPGEPEQTDSVELTLGTIL